MFDIGVVQLLYLSNYAEATRWFRRYLDDYPDGVLADDAAWHLVELERLRGDDAAYRGALQAFIDDYPESRYVRRANARLGLGEAT